MYAPCAIYPAPDSRQTKNGAEIRLRLLRDIAYAMAKMMDAIVPSIIMIATIRLKILRPLLIVSRPLRYLPIDA